MKLLNYLRGIKRALSNYEPFVKVYISQKNLLHNLNEFKSTFPALSFAPVLKSNAYGHGLVQTAMILDKQNIAFFVVDSVYEAMQLRSSGIKSKILILGYFTVNHINNVNLRGTSFTITSLEQLKELDKALTKKRQFHIKVDTGMHRQGLLPSELDEAINIIRNNKLIELEGVCSHFSDSDGADQAFSRQQIKVWEHVVKKFKGYSFAIKFFHLANSAGTFYFKQATFNVGRLGIGLYGINDSNFMKLDLKPVLKMESVVSGIKNISAGDTVGYNMKFQADKPMKIATVPVGYFEGVDRRLANLGSFMVNGITCPILGRVSMNITSIDVSQAPNLKINDPVLIISDDPSDPNSLEKIGAQLNTTPREISIHIPQHLRRVIS